jgi:tetratricopeptide (TPR) repeat protein
MPLREIDVLLEQMRSLMESRRFAEAIQIGQILLTKIPTSAHDNRALTYYNLGLCSNELGQYPEAEERYAASIRENPIDSDAWYNRAKNYNNWGAQARRSDDVVGSPSLWTKAIECAQKARQLNPTDPECVQLVALISSNLAL